MLQFYEKHSWRVAFRSWWFVAFLLLLTIFLAVVVYDRYTIQTEMSKRRMEAEKQVEILRARKDEIAEKVEYLDSDRGMEAEMRRNFDVAQPGEQVVIILDDESTDQAIEPLTSSTADTPPWYIFWR